MGKGMNIKIDVVSAEALDFECDVLVIKYAQALHGLDRHVYHRLTGKTVETTGDLPQVGGVELMPSHGCLGAESVLFIGTPRLSSITYDDIKMLAYRSISSLDSVKLSRGHIAMTVHGPGFGLDEVEAFNAMLIGIAEAASSGLVPDGLRKVSFLERHPGRAARLRGVLKQSALVAKLMDEPNAAVASATNQAEVQRQLRSRSQPRVFVAMPFADEYGDIWELGIYDVAKDLGCLCERIDQVSFIGDILDKIKNKISEADMVIALLTGSNPNVYLEVGYAWGRSISTILLVNDASSLGFDVRGQRCVVYRNIVHLKSSLRTEMQSILDRS